MINWRFKILFKISIFSVLLIVSGCARKTQRGDAYIGGEIKNPSSKTVYVYREGEVVDTLSLDDQNFFELHLSDITTGMYSFMHGNEYQLAVVEPGDSIVVRGNTIDFDQSLVYMGRGAKKNNFLVQLFLEMEQESQSMFEISQMMPKAFVIRIDSLELGKTERLNKFLKQNKHSEVYHDLIKAGIKYNYGAMREAYPFRHFDRLDKVTLEQLPENYFDFRSDLNYNDAQLAHFHHYYNYLFPHFNTLALQQLVEERPDRPVNQQSPEFYLTKLGLMDARISDPIIKNNILKYTTKSLLSNSNNPRQQEDLLQFFYNHSQSDSDKAYMANWFSSLTKIDVGQRFPEVEVIDTNGNTMNIHQLFDRTTVCTFWTTEAKAHFENSHERLAYLRKTFDQVNFISINTDNNQSEEWESFLRGPEVVRTSEYRFRDPNAAKKILALYNVNKVVLVDNKGKVVLPNANLFSRKFNYKLNSLSKN